MAADDVVALGRVLGRRGEGLIEIFQQSERKLLDNLAFVERLAESSGRPVLYNVVGAVAGHPAYHRQQLAWLADCNRRGLRIWGQGATVRQPFHVMLADWNLYDMSAAWKQALLGSHEDKKRNLHDAAMRSAMIRDYDEGRIPVGMLGGPIEDRVPGRFAFPHDARIVRPFGACKTGSLDGVELSQALRILAALEREGVEYVLVGSVPGSEHRGDHGR